MMNSFDFLIIYLTCGAPLGVFYFLQYRKEQNRAWLWLKTFLTFIFWLPFGFRLLQNKTHKKFFIAKKIFSKSDKTENAIFQFQKRLEKILQKSNLQISIFEFREVIERYVGLTQAKNCEKAKTTETENAIFSIENNKNIEIGAICLNRRNLKRLTFHQIQARQDFFQVINQLANFVSDEEEFSNSATGFFQLLKDDEARSAFGKTLLDNSRNKENFVADRSEKYLWNTEIRKPPLAKPSASQLQTLTATATLSPKD